MSDRKRQFISDTLAAVERFDDAFSEGKTDGPMPNSLRESIKQAKHYVALVCWCGEVHEPEEIAT